VCVCVECMLSFCGLCVVFGVWVCLCGGYIRSLCTVCVVFVCCVCCLSVLCISLYDVCMWCLSVCEVYIVFFLHQ
jgi:hypothetical protein